MITEILKERTTDQKPRFFLHDEVKEWLSNNLEIYVKASPNYSTKWDLQNRLQNYGVYHPLLTGFSIETSVTVAGEPIQHTDANTISIPLEEISSLLVAHMELTKESVNKLQQENLDLRRRIDLLENPLPL